MESQVLTPRQLHALLPPERSMFPLEEVRLLVPGRSDVGIFRPRADAPYIYAGHLPGVFAIQLSIDMGYLVSQTDPAFAGRPHLLLGVNSARFYQEILPGSTVKIRSAVTARREDKPILTVEADIFADGQRAASTSVALYLL